MVSSIFENRHQEGSQKALSEIGEELKKQDAWIKHLHSYSRELHSYTDFIKESNVTHKKEIYTHLNSIAKWIDYLNNSHNEMKKEVSNLKSSLKEMLKNDFENYHRLMQEYLILKLSEDSKKKDMIKQEVLEELKKEFASVLDKSRKTGIIMPITNADNALPDKKIMHYNAEIELNNSEKEILSLLFNENKPLTYENIANKLNKSVNTIRVYMNSLKVKKGIIEEFVTPKGTKVFSIKNSEMVKTLFNLK